ncbi:hypothetical protein [Brevundimonas sp. A19_0]|nr:hypothetical protein [Brevundimonas sp. A19_0]
MLGTGSLSRTGAWTMPMATLMSLVARTTDVLIVALVFSVFG